MLKKIILDTDAGSDCDDMLALALLSYYVKFGSVSIPAVTYSFTSPYGPATLRATFRSLGSEIPEIGICGVSEDNSDDHYCKAVADRFAQPEDSSACVGAVQLLRRKLAESDGATICAIGPLTNIAALLKTGPDALSDLSGTELMRRKCTELVAMSGDFRDMEDGKHVPEWNVKQNIEAAQTVFSLCPVPVTLIPWELGDGIVTGGYAVKCLGIETPVTLSFILHGAQEGRQSWDPVSVLYAVEGCGDFFTKSSPGTVTVAPDGATYFEVTPGGRHSILNVSMLKYGDTTAAKRAIAEYIDKKVNKILNV